MSPTVSRRSLLIGAAALAATLAIPLNRTLAQGYDREAAASWAMYNAYEPELLPTDCTWFVSRALWVGGLPQSYEWTGESTDFSLLADKLIFPGPTKAAAHADTLINYLINNGLAYRSGQPINWQDQTADGASLGDIIAYDWYNQFDGTTAADGTIDHVAIVTSFDGIYPYVSQHTPAQSSRGWSWSETRDGWIELENPGCEAHLIHITHFDAEF